MATDDLIHGSIESLVLQYTTVQKHHKAVVHKMDVLPHLISSEVSLSITEVSQIKLSFSDPAFTLLNSSMFNLGSVRTYNRSPYVTTVVETTDGGGNGGFDVTYRPNAINRLRSKRGKKEMKNKTAWQFVASECAAAGLHGSVIQRGGPFRKKIARDLAQKHTQYDQWSYPSAWTTLQRLAPEEGYMVSEISGRIYFGKPSEIAKALGHTVTVQWVANPKETDPNSPLAFPQCRRSLDSMDVDIGLTLPYSRKGECIPGRRLHLTGVPKFSGSGYYITSVTYPLHEATPITVTAATLRNPKPTGDPDQK
jgi:hypothetical protein